MTITATVHFLPEGKSFVKEQPSMEKPNFFQSAAWADEQQHDWDAYHKHVASRPEYPYPTCTPEEDGRVGEFRLQHQIRGKALTQWMPTTPDTYETFSDEYRRIIAIAHPQECAHEPLVEATETHNYCPVCKQYLPTPSESGINPTRAGETFGDYMNNAREEFINKVAEQDWDTDLRVAAENIIICFDQMRERLAGAAASQHQEEHTNQNINSLLSEFKRQGFDTSNWDGDEGWEKAIVDGIKNHYASQQGEVERLKGIIKHEFYVGLRGWGTDAQREIVWQSFKKNNNL